MNQYRSRLLSAAAIFATLAAPALAADADEVIFVDDANFVKPAELGSSWYIRGEIGYNFDGRHDVSVGGNPITDTFTENTFMDRTHFSVGVGYRVNPFLRIDANVGRLAGSDMRSAQLMYEQGTEPVGTDPSLIVVPADPGDPSAAFDPNPCNGYGEFIDSTTGVTSLDVDFITNCIRNDTIEYDTTYGMVNAYIDLPAVAGFQPFVGAGIGIGRVTYREEVNAVDCVPRAEDVRFEGCRAYGVPDQPAANTPYSSPGTVAEGVDYRFGYQLAAGLGYALTDNLSVDTTYRYTNFGGGDFDTGSGSSLADDGYSTHQVNLGFRYSLF
ncbi:MAG: outer membrane beta-barrel protein [Pseudomonadota bacterium]